MRGSVHGRGITHVIVGRWWLLAQVLIEHALVGSTEPQALESKKRCLDEQVRHTQSSPISTHVL
jgi:hypothetical protein